MFDPHTEVEPALLLPQAVMKRLNVTRGSLRRWEEAGTLVPVRLPSGHRRYRRADVEAILAGTALAPAVGQ